MSRPRIDKDWIKSSYSTVSQLYVIPDSERLNQVDHESDPNRSSAEFVYADPRIVTIPFAYWQATFIDDPDNTLGIGLTGSIKEHATKQWNALRKRIRSRLPGGLSHKRMKFENRPARLVADIESRAWDCARWEKDPRTGIVTTDDTPRRSPELKVFNAEEAETLLRSVATCCGYILATSEITILHENYSKRWIKPLREFLAFHVSQFQEVMINDFEDSPSYSARMACWIEAIIQDSRDWFRAKFDMIGTITIPISVLYDPLVDFMAIRTTEEMFDNIDLGRANIWDHILDRRRPDYSRSSAQKGEKIQVTEDDLREILATIKRLDLNHHMTTAESQAWSNLKWRAQDLLHARKKISEYVG